MKKLYVIGFAFYGDKVALIKKNKPEWQAGKLNGIGGKIEENEMPLGAMIREFEEETGCRWDAWDLYATMSFTDALVYCYRTVMPDKLESLLRTVEDEEIVFVNVDEIKSLNTIPNLRWLIPLANEGYKNFLATIKFED